MVRHEPREPSLGNPERTKTPMLQKNGMNCRIFLHQQQKQLLEQQETTMDLSWFYYKTWVMFSRHHVWVDRVWWSQKKFAWLFKHPLETGHPQITHPKLPNKTGGPQKTNRCGKRKTQTNRTRLLSKVQAQWWRTEQSESVDAVDAISWKIFFFEFLTSINN